MARHTLAGNPDGGCVGFVDGRCGSMKPLILPMNRSTVVALTISIAMSGCYKRGEMRYLRSDGFHRSGRSEDVAVGERVQVERRSDGRWSASGIPRCRTRERGNIIDHYERIDTYRKWIPLAVGGGLLFSTVLGVALADGERLLAAVILVPVTGVPGTYVLAEGLAGHHDEIEASEKPGTETWQWRGPAVDCGEPHLLRGTALVVNIAFAESATEHDLPRAISTTVRTDAEGGFSLGLDDVDHDLADYCPTSEIDVNRPIGQRPLESDLDPNALATDSYASGTILGNVPPSHRYARLSMRGDERAIADACIAGLRAACARNDEYRCTALRTVTSRETTSTVATRAQPAPVRAPAAAPATSPPPTLAAAPTPTAETIRRCGAGDVGACKLGCAQADATSCETAARKLSEGGRIAVDRPAATAALLTACTLGRVGACQSAAAILRKNAVTMPGWTADEVNLALALVLSEACKLGDAASCGQVRPPPQMRTCDEPVVVVTRDCTNTSTDPDCQPCTQWVTQSWTDSCWNKKTASIDTWTESSRYCAERQAPPPIMESPIEKVFTFQAQLRTPAPAPCPPDKGCGHWIW